MDFKVHSIWHVSGTGLGVPLSNTVSLGQAASTARGGGNKRGVKRGFGSIRQLPSGRYQARYTGPDGTEHRAPVTFAAKVDATAWLSMQQAAITEHRWKPAPPPDPTTMVFGDYARAWLEARELGPRTRSEYRRLIEGRLRHFDHHTLDQITAAAVKRWWQDQGPQYPTARRRAYDLLHAILDSATKPDEDTDAAPLLATNPARLSAKTLRTSPTKAGARIRPATVAELEAIAAAMPERYRAMLLLAAWCQLRFGELTELRRRDVTFTVDDSGAPLAGVLHIRRAVVWTDPDTPVVKEPKSAAGIRDVAIPPHVLPPLIHHLENWSADGSDGLVFPAVESGSNMKHGALYKVYRRARSIAGRPDLRWHDLRHTGATMAAQAGATLAELMNRLGHSDVRAALIYQHATADRDAELARKLSKMAEGA